MDWEASAGPSSGLRLGVPPELCARPLTHGLAALAGVSLEEEAPAVLAERLRAGELDYALLRPIDCFQLPSCRLVPGLGVCTEHEARTERLLARVSPEHIRRVGIDIHSHASTLVHIVLAESFGIAPEFVAVEPEQEHDAGLDAIVLSGNTALRNRAPSDHSFDLGALWHDLTGLPLVHMAWAAGPRTPHAELRRILASALQSGLDNLAAIAEDAPKTDGIDPETAREFLGNTLHYRMASAEADGLREFLRLAVKHGLCEADADIQFC